MKTRPVLTAAALTALASLATASTTISRAQTAQTTSATTSQVTVVLKRNSLALTEGKKTATVTADRITYQRGDKKAAANGAKSGGGFKSGAQRKDAGDLNEARYRLSGDYHIVTADGWEWTGRDAELILTDITSSRGMKQNLVVVNAIGPMHQRRPITAPDGTKTIEEHDITDKPVAPGHTVGVSFYINSPTYIMNKWGKEEIHFKN